MSSPPSTVTPPTEIHSCTGHILDAIRHLTKLSNPEPQVLVYREYTSPCYICGGLSQFALQATPNMVPDTGGKTVITNGKVLLLMVCEGHTLVGLRATSNSNEGLNSKGQQVGCDVLVNFDQSGICVLCNNASGIRAGSFYRMLPTSLFNYTP